MQDLAHKTCRSLGSSLEARAWLVNGRVRSRLDNVARAGWLKRNP